MTFTSYFNHLLKLGFESDQALQLELLAVRTAQQSLVREGKSKFDAKNATKRVGEKREQLYKELVREMKKGAATEYLFRLLLGGFFV